MKISVRNDGFTTSAFRDRKSFTFPGIVCVASEKVDKITYEELFLVVHSSTGGGVVIGELDEGFADLEKALSGHLKGFPTDWKVDAEERPAGIRKEIWRSDEPFT